MMSIERLIAYLLELAKPALDPKTDAWQAQEKFVTTLQDAFHIYSHRSNGSDSTPTDQPLTSQLWRHVSLLIPSLATTVSCGRSGTQCKALDCFRGLFERASNCGALRDALDRNMDQAYTAIVKLVEHNSAGFLSAQTVQTLRAGMRHVSAGKLAHSLAREINSKAHDANLKKMTTLTTLLADAIDMLVYGQFQGAPAQKDYPCTQANPTPSLSQIYYKDLIRTAVKLKKGQLPQLQAGCNTLIVGLVTKGSLNSVLIAELRDLAKTDRTIVQVFETAYKTLTGKDLPSVTGASTNGEFLSPSGLSKKPFQSSTLTSPLPSTLASGTKKLTASSAKKHYSETMPAGNGLLSPASIEVTSVTANMPVIIPLSDRTFALPTSSSSSLSSSRLSLSGVDYQTAGAGLLDELSEANACDSTDVALGASAFNYTYDDTCLLNTSGQAGENANDGATTLNTSSLEAEGPTKALEGMFDGVADHGLTGVDDEDEILFQTNVRSSPSPAPATGFDVPVELMSPTSGLNLRSSTSSSSTTSVVYNYDRSSMIGTSTRSSAQHENDLTLTDMTPNTTINANTNLPRTRLSGGLKRKHVDDEIDPSSVQLELFSPSSSASSFSSSITRMPSVDQSPRTRLTHLKSLAHFYKKQKASNGDAIGTSSTLSAHSALQMANELTGQQIESTRDTLRQQSGYWKEKREILKVKRQVITNRRNTSTAANLSNAAPIPINIEDY